jgi:hypothetical protein
MRAFAAPDSPEQLSNPAVAEHGTPPTARDLLKKGALAADDS